MLTYRVDFESLPWQTPMAGVRARALDHGGRRLRLVEYTPEMQPHWCSRGHVGLLLEGEFELRFADRTEMYRAGDGVFIPAGDAHRHMGIARTAVVRAVFVEDV